MLKNHQPDTEAMRLSLGEALRERRTELKLSMQSVADGAGLSVGFISQVERGLAAPSLGSLASIANVLDLRLSQLLDQPGPGGETTRQDARQPYGVPGVDLTYERVSAKFAGSKLHSVIIHEHPGRRSEPISHEGEEMFFMLSGEITVEIEGKIDILRKGDSIHFDSRRRHSTWNHTAEVASLLWCGTMDVFDDGPEPIHKAPPEKGADPHPTGEGDS